MSAGGERDGRPLSAGVASLTGRRHLVLLRHAWAGHRAGWSGDDRDRPLDAHGVAQASALVGHLPRALGVDLGGAVLLSSPTRRCTTTLDPLATVHGQTVHRDERLVDTVAPVAALADAPAGEVLVVCSHGEVLPDLLAAVADAAGLPVPATVDLTPKALPKGAAWHVDLAAGTVRELPPPPVPSRP